MWPLLTMHITQLNRECLLHLFSFLDKDSRKSLARTCSQLHDVFEDPALWSLLHFRSLTELQKDNFLLGPALRSLSICWHSSRVQVCSIEDWLKSAFQRSICSRHERLVNDFLLQVCDRLSAVPSPRRREAPAPLPRGLRSPLNRNHLGGEDLSTRRLPRARAAARRGLESLRAERPRENRPAPGVLWGPPSPRPPVVISVKQEEGKQGRRGRKSFARTRVCLPTFLGADALPE
uniref:F-box and leucine-rich protein 22 n=1 Tax=Rhinopithecus bieti TaxID=61621 RepID=A0A2K6KY81_RHIBE